MQTKSQDIRDGERLDDLGIKGYKLIQNPNRFCFGIDAVLLSDYAKIHEGEKVLDLCTGNGIIPILLAAKTKASHISALEIQEDVAELAGRNVIYNNLSDRVSVIKGDVKDSGEIFGVSEFDVVTVNPPYMICGHGLENEDSPFTVARHEIACTLLDVLKAAYKLLKPKGRFYMVHRPLRLVEILSSMSMCKIEPKALRFVHPYVDKEPNLVLIEGRKDAASEIRVAKPLFVYDSPGQYTKEIMEIYGIE